MNDFKQPQRRVRRGEGPVGLVLSPTRELAEQTCKEAARMLKPAGLRCVAVGGGGGKYEMACALKEGAEVVVATPGRLMEFIGSGKATKIIAEQMGISTRTVEAHRAHIKEKLGLTDGAELVRYAVQWVENSGRKA